MGEGYAIQPWLVWSVLAALLMLGAWLRMGGYLLCLGLAALLALVEALAGARSLWQIASFIVASCVLFLLYWGMYGKKNMEKTSPKGDGNRDSDTEGGAKG